MILLIMVYTSLMIDAERYTTFDECEKAAKAVIGKVSPNEINSGYTKIEPSRVAIAFCAKGHILGEDNK